MIIPHGFTASTYSGDTHSYLTEVVMRTNITAPLWTITKTWKQSNSFYQQKSEHINWYVYKLNNYRVIKTNELQQYATIGMNFSHITLNEKSNSQKSIYNVILCHTFFKNENIYLGQK